MAEELTLTREGYEKIKAEYEELVSKTRAEIAEKLKEARAFGDLSENAEYDAAKNEQAEVEARIVRLETMMREAKIVEKSAAGRTIVNVGNRVTVKNADSGDENVYEIVGATESDPFNGKISNKSPIGKGLIGHRVGDEVSIDIPDVYIKLEILKIER